MSQFLLNLLLFHFYDPLKEFECYLVKQEFLIARVGIIFSGLCVLVEV